MSRFYQILDKKLVYFNTNVKQFLSWALKDPHFKILSYFSANLITFSLFVILLYYFPCQIVLYA